jgi:aryl-alcohol dehydrogenase-like predicted oxidoreductase
MQTRRLGRQGPELSVIGFGAMEVGEIEGWDDRPSDDVLVDVIRSAVDAGITWIDTAEVYGDGNSERLVGEALAGRRDEALIATKVAPDDGGSGFRPDQVRAACEASLRRLQTDHIDLYQLHWWPEAVHDWPIEETWGAMVDLVDAGMVRFIGVSNFDQGQIERCLAVRHVDSLQPQLSMAQPRFADLIRWCGDRGIGVVPYQALAGGLFGPHLPSEEELRASLGERAWARRGPAVLDLLRAIHPMAERAGMSVPHLALAWTLEHPGVTSPIVGSTNPDHIREAAEAGDVRLDDADLVELNALVGRVRDAVGV